MSLTLPYYTICSLYSHVVLSKDLFDRLPAKEEEEDDMLDLAWGLTDT